MNDRAGVEVETRQLRVAIVEDQAPLRDGLARLLAQAPGMACVGAWGTMEAALAQVAAAQPALMLIDLGLPKMDGIEGIRALHDRHPEIITLVLSVFDDDDRVFRALCAGASGYLLKNTPPDRLIAGLRDAAEGGSPMSPEIARRVITLFREFAPASGAECHLTPHEVRLLRLLSEGHSYRTAAEELGVTRNTISFHLKSIYTKLSVHSKSEAVAQALRRGLIR